MLKLFRLVGYGAALLVLLVPAASSAHLDAGADQVIGNYLVDFGYAPATPKAGERVDLVLNLLDNATQKIIVPDHVWVRIDSGNDTFFAGTFFPEGTNVTFVQTFPAAGDYDFKVQFFDKKHLLVEATLHLPVAAKPSPATTSAVPHPARESGQETAILALLAVALLGVGFVIGKGRS